MELGKIHTIPTVDLVNILTEIVEQEEKNIIIYELTYRMYVPFNSEVTFEELLLMNGYVPTNNKRKIK